MSEILVRIIYDRMVSEPPTNGGRDVRCWRIEKAEGPPIVTQKLTDWELEYAPMYGILPDGYPVKWGNVLDATRTRPEVGMWYLQIVRWRTRGRAYIKQVAWVDEAFKAWNEGDRPFRFAGEKETRDPLAILRPARLYIPGSLFSANELCQVTATS